MFTVVILVINVLTMSLHEGFQALPQATTLPLVGFTSSPSGSPCPLCISRVLWLCVSFALSLFPLGSCFLEQVMDRLSSSASTVPSIDDYFEHNVWNPLLELLFLEQANGIFVSYLVEWSHCLVTLLLIYMLHRALLSMEFLFVCGTIAILATSCSFMVDAFVKKNTKHLRLLSGTVHSGTVLYRSVIIGGFGDVPFRENFSGIFVMPRAAGHLLVHGPAATSMLKPWSPSDRSLFNCPAPCQMRTRKSITFCSSDESPPAHSHSSKCALFKVSPVGIQNTCSRALSDAFPFIWDSKSAGVAPLPPCSRKLLDETVKTFAVFPSWLHLLDGEDNCMLSVPLSTSDLHYSRWQSGVIYQGLSTGAFALLCHVLLTSLMVFSYSFSFVGCCLAHAFVCRMSPVFSA